MSRIDLVVPDLGNFQEVSVVEVLVKPGDSVEVDAPLVTLETDKASMDVPSTHAGTIAEDGRTITGAWEICHDGQTWQHDFDLRYEKLG